MRVLVVEDEIALRDSLKERLADAGFTVDVASDGEEGLFARDVDGHLVRMDKVTASDFDRDVTLTIDGRTITVKKAVPATDSQGNFLKDEQGRAIPRATTIYDAASLAQACATGLADASQMIKRLEAMPLGNAGARDLLDRWDRLRIRLEDFEGPVDLTANVSPDAATRSAAEACESKTTRFETELYQNAALYARIKALTARTGPAAKMRKNLLDTFEDPQFIHDLMRVTTDFCKLWGDAIVKTGIGLSFSEPTASIRVR